MHNTDRIVSLLVESAYLQRQILEEIRKMGTTVGVGLQSLENVEAAEVTALVALQTAVTTAVADLQQTIANAGEDATVGSIAATMQTQLDAITQATSALNAATAPPAPATPAAD